MRCEYIFSNNDFLESMKAYRKRAKGAAFVYYLDVWILPGLGILAALVCLSAYVRREQDLFESTFWLACLGIVAAIGLPILYRLKLRQIYKQRTTLSKDKPIFFEFDEDSVRFTMPGRADVAYSWDSFTDYFENDLVAVLFVQKAAFHTIPKRAMNENGWAELRQLVKTKVRNS